jgi:hypothetical protein
MRPPLAQMQLLSTEGVLQSVGINVDDPLLPVRHLQQAATFLLQELYSLSRPPKQCFLNKNLHWFSPVQSNFKAREVPCQYYELATSSRCHSSSGMTL